MARRTTMSPTPPPDHPAPPSLAGRSIRPRFGPLEQSCLELAMNHLDQCLAHALDAVDDALFAQADRATNNLEQALFFDGMRALRNQRPQILRRFHQRLSGFFAAYLEGQEPQIRPSASELSLIGHDEHEERLQLDQLARRCRSRCARELGTLERRLAQLTPRPAAALRQDSPFAPETLAESLRLALAGEPLPLPIRRTLYELVEQQALACLDELYAGLNQLLIDAAILPNISDQPPRPRSQSNEPRPPRPASDTSRSREPVAASNPPRSREPAAASESQHSRESAASGDAWSEEPRNENERLFRGVTQLLSRRHDSPAQHSMPPASAAAGERPPENAGATPPAGTGTLYSEEELIAALTRLQQVSVRELGDSALPRQDAQQLKARLHAELEAACTLPARPQLEADAADIIDLVGMLFAFVLDDPTLPDRCKTVLSHLHTPYLKLALRDHQLFTQDIHPARQLLDSMAKAGARFAEDDDASGLQAKMQEIVERILRDFDSDSSLFSELLADFEEHVRRLQQRVELRERRTLDTARGRDRLHVARQQAAEQIHRVLAGRTLPQPMRELLEKGWSDVLALIHLRQGEDSEEWLLGCQAAEQLAWSCTPLGRHGRERMQRERLGLLERLREGLQQLGSLSDADIRRLLQDVVACQHAVQAGQPELVAELTIKLPESSLGALLQPQAAAESLSEEAENLPPEQEAQLRQLEALPFGSLFGFLEDGQVRRLRLSWFSPASRHYLFIDPTGEHSRTWSAARLAQGLHDGSVYLLGQPSDSPLMKRALQAIYRVLQRLEEGQPAGG
ncbi:DUF1631 domain-containing protein [Pseudomonas sp. GCM10022188]|uniref:DUF1631 domain-containing protein n=1 Tax=Pseudomonas TaxID=286 RepID=UPI0029E7F738|nr:DUF1631 domain-containing protein [Pseudomonas oryzagri]